MATALKERFSYFTDPFSAQWFASITHHFQVKTHFPLKENWICLITYSPNFLVLSLACQQFDSDSAPPLCPRPTLKNTTLCSSVVQLNNPYKKKVARSYLKMSLTKTKLLYVVLMKLLHLKVFTETVALTLDRSYVTTSRCLKGYIAFKVGTCWINDRVDSNCHFVICYWAVKHPNE